MIRDVIELDSADFSDAQELLFAGILGRLTDGELDRVEAGGHWRFDIRVPWGWRWMAGVEKARRAGLEAA